MPPRAHTDPFSPPRSPLLDVPQKTTSGASSPTQYEFIMSTGDESATAARQKLKTVRSHVMKNYLQQQQQKQGRASKDMAFSATGERRKSKQRARSNRSASQEFDQHQPVQRGEHPASFGIGSLFAGVSLVDSFAGHRISHCSTCNPNDHYSFIRALLMADNLSLYRKSAAIRFRLQLHCSARRSVACCTDLYQLPYSG